MTALEPSPFLLEEAITTTSCIASLFERVGHALSDYIGQESARQSSLRMAMADLESALALHKKESAHSVFADGGSYSSTVHADVVTEVDYASAAPSEFLPVELRGQFAPEFCSDLDFDQSPCSNWSDSSSLSPSSSSSPPPPPPLLAEAGSLVLPDAPTAMSSELAGLTASDAAVRMLVPAFSPLTKVDARASLTVPRVTGPIIVPLAETTRVSLTLSRIPVGGLADSDTTLAVDDVRVQRSDSEDAPSDESLHPDADHSVVDATFADDAADATAVVARPRKRKRDARDTDGPGRIKRAAIQPTELCVLNWKLSFTTWFKPNTPSLYPFGYGSNSAADRVGLRPGKNCAPMTHFLHRLLPSTRQARSGGVVVLKTRPSKSGALAEWTYHAIYMRRVAPPQFPPDACVGILTALVSQGADLLDVNMRHVEQLIWTRQVAMYEAYGDLHNARALLQRVRGWVRDLTKYIEFIDYTGTVEDFVHALDYRTNVDGAAEMFFCRNCCAARTRHTCYYTDLEQLLRDKDVAALDCWPDEDIPYDVDLTAPTMHPGAEELGYPPAIVQLRTPVRYVAPTTVTKRRRDYRRRSKLYKPK